MNKQLKQLNFNDLLILNDSENIDSYDFNVYMQNDQHLVKGYCTKCEEKGCNICPQDSEYKLTNISHGASSDDIFLATEQEGIDFSDWHNDGVMFIMEGPSIDNWGLYEEVEFNGHKKRPARLWYWVHDKQEKFEYPKEFWGKTYGTLFNSIIFTFKLRNAYLTNFVKCGLNNDNNQFKGIKEYNYSSVTNCFENYLMKELEIVKPKVVFCFGSSVINNLNDMYPDDYPFTVVGLPHPARARSGFKDEYYRHLYYSLILEGLYKAEIISKEQAQVKYGDFLEKQTS
jgi:hypothetical protein